MEIQKVLVLGAGLIGGSIIRAIRKYQPQIILEVAVRNPENYPNLSFFAEKVYAINQIPSSNWDLVLIATITNSIVSLAQFMASKIKEDAIITDAGSIKEPILNACKNIPQFIGSHPMAGKEKGGFSQSDPDLLFERVVAVCPQKTTPYQNIQTLCQFWESLGAETVVKSALEHDQIVAYTSHFPHVISFLFAKLGLDYKIDPQKIAGNSFADFTRIASSAPKMWSEIFLLNKKNLGFLIENFIKFLSDLNESIQNEKGAFIEEIIFQSNLFMEKLSQGKNILSEDLNGRRTV